MTGTTHEAFLSQRYFGPLDGLRAASILLVVALHTTDPMWIRLHGAIGVTAFFVISGFLITTLLLREEAKAHRASIRAFYLRRAFRILPLYYVALLGYVVLIGVLKLQSGAADLWRALPWYLTYQNEFAPTGSGFGHTWSLAVEEKFYLFWPLVFVVLLLRRHRLAVVAGLAALAAVASLWPQTGYAATYAPILLGCLAAVVLDQEEGFRRTQRLAATPFVLVLLALTVVQVALWENDGQVHIVFGLLVTLLLPAVLFGPRWVSAVLDNPVARYVGTRSYAVYLIHRMAKGVVDRVIAPHGSAPDQVARLVLITLVALLGAEVLYRTVEQPMIRLGRRLSATERRGRAMPSVSLSAPGSTGGTPPLSG